MLLEYRHFLGGQSETIHQPAKQALKKRPPQPSSRLARTDLLALHGHTAGLERMKNGRTSGEAHGILMVFNVGKTIINHPLGRVNIPPIKTVITGGWFMIVLPTWMGFECFHAVSQPTMGILFSKKTLWESAFRHLGLPDLCAGAINGFSQLETWLPRPPTSGH